LKEKIEQRPLPLKDVVNYSIQIAAGLQKAHEKRIVHRDLKPANIFITEDNQVKIIDFGLAKAAERSLLTKSGTTLGTAPYMSPEQAQGGKVDHRTDIWSLGVLMYEMIAGQRPFKSDYETALVYSIINEEPEPVTGLRSGVPMDLERIIKKCLRKDGSFRYQHIEDILIDLKELRIETAKEAASMSKKRFSRFGNTRKIFKIKTFYILLIFILVTVGGFVIHNVITKTPDLLIANRVVVAVFENQTGDPSLDPLGRMASDWITQGISMTGLVDAVPSSIVLFSFIEENKNFNGVARLTALSKETGAGIIVSGTYYLVGENINFNAQITDAVSRTLIRSLEPISTSRQSPLEGIGQLQHDVMIELAKVFDFRISGFADVIYPKSYDAYLAYIEGVEDFYRMDYSAAIEKFTRSYAIDPDFIPPLGYMTQIYLNTGNYVLADSINTLVGKRSSQMDLSPLDIKYHEYWQAVLSGDLSGQLRALRSAYEIAPGHQETLNLLRNVNLRTGRYRENIELFSALHPDGIIMRKWYPIREGITLSYHLLGEHNKELKASKDALKQYPDNIRILATKVRALSARGKLKQIHDIVESGKTLPATPEGTKWDHLAITAGRELRIHGFPDQGNKYFKEVLLYYEALPGDQIAVTRYNRALLNSYLEEYDTSREILTELLDTYPDNISYWGLLGIVEAATGNHEEALRIFQMLESIDRPYVFGNNFMWCARIAAALGEKERAVRFLKASFESGTPIGIILHTDLHFESIRDYPPFQDLLRPI
jgi:serine/threonine protein kinase/tetratricopeptide (TPR) repeat protein